MSISMEHRVLAKLNRLNTSKKPGQDEFDAVDWPKFWTAATSNAVMTLTKDRLTALDIKTDIPADILRSIERTKIVNRKRLESFNRFLAVTNERQIPIILLKGMAFGISIYGCKFYKQMNDCDILIRTEDVQIVKDILRENGFVSAGDIGSAEQDLTKTHHSPPFLSLSGDCVIGLHWGLCPPDKDYHPNMTDIWQQKSLLPEFGSHVFRMSWTHNLLHLVIHLPKYKLGMRELADVMNGIDCMSDEELASLFMETQKWNAFNPLYRILRITTSMFQENNYNQLIREMKPQVDTFTILEASWRCSRKKNLFNSRSVICGSVEKMFVAVQMSPNRSTRIHCYKKLMKHLFFPPLNDCLKLTNLPNHPIGNILSRLMSPAIIWHALAQDHGHRFIILGLGYLTIRTLKDIANTVMDTNITEESEPLVLDVMKGLE